MRKQFVITRARVAAIAVLMLLSAGCVGGDPETTPPMATDGATTTQTTADSDPIASSSGDDDPAATIGIEPDLLALEELWAEFWSATGLVPDERPAAIAAFGDSLDPSVAELAPTLLLESTLREVYTFPIFSPAIDGTTVAIKDCIIYDPEIFESTTHVHSGTAILDDDGEWIIESIVRESRGCIPAELNLEILADYEEYWNARRVYWNPPNPADPAINETMSGQYRDLIRDRIRMDEEEGFVFVQDKLEIHPEVLEVLSATRVRLLDCVQLDPTDGVFDQTGERAGESRPRGADEQDLYTTTMILEGGQWKAEDVDVKIDEDCQFAPTPAGLREIE